MFVMMVYLKLMVPGQTELLSNSILRDSTLLCFRCRYFLPRRPSTRPSTTPLASCLSLESFTNAAPSPRAGNLRIERQLLISSSLFSFFSTPASHFISSNSSQDKIQSRFGVVVATCFVRCTLLYLFQHCMTDPAFWSHHSPLL